MHISSIICGALALVISSNFITPVHSVAPCQRDVARPRKEVRGMSASEWTAYANAMKALKAEMRSTSRGQISTYDLLVNIHLANANWVHGYANFFSWHRRYLREVERHAQRVTGNTAIMIPYWDWTIDSQSPEASPIFTSAYFGGNGGSTGRGGCVVTGTFRNWTPSFPSAACLRRQFDATTRLSAWDSEELVASIVVSSSDYNELREQIEGGGHASVHVNIGGDMSRMQSPNDPIFWSHHAFIDKLWNDWQARGGWSNYWSYGGPNSDGTQASLNDQMRPWSHTVRQILWTENIGYCYQHYNGPDGAPPQWLGRRQADSAAAPAFITVTPVSDPVNQPATDDESDGLLRKIAPISAVLDADDDDDDDDDDANLTLSASTVVHPLDRSNLFKLRAPNPIPEDYLVRNNLNVNRVRQYEAQKQQLCARLNGMDDYLSPCAIANRPELLVKVAGYSDVTKMYGVANGKRLQIDTSKISSEYRKGTALGKYVQQTIKSRFGAYINSSRSRYLSAMADN